jgi:hypothetical protein
MNKFYLLMLFSSILTNNIFAQKVKVKNDTAIVYNDVETAIEYSNKNFKIFYIITDSKESSLSKDFSKIKSESLIGFYCDNCYLESLPKLSKFINLDFLELNWYMTGAAPDNKKAIEEVLKLRNLKYLEIHGFPLSANLKIKSKELESLHLTKTGLDVFPKEILGLVKLKNLYLGCNEIKAIPDEIENLKALEHLSFSGGACGGNPIEFVSPKIGKLTKLKSLFFEGGSLKTPPKEIFKLPKLAFLSFHYCNIESFPVIRSGGALKNFTLSAGDEFKGFPKSFSSLRLEKLNIHIHKPSLGAVKTRKIVEAMESKAKEYNVSIGKKELFPNGLDSEERELFGVWEVIESKSSEKELQLIPEIASSEEAGKYLVLSFGSASVSSFADGPMNVQFKLHRIGDHLTGVLKFAAAIMFGEENKGYQFYFDSVYNSSTKELKITNSKNQIYYLKKID